MAGEAEAAHAERVAAIVEEAERVALEATRAQGTGTRRRGGAGGTAASLRGRRRRRRERDERKKRRVGVFPRRRARGGARVAAAEARGEAARLISALGADPELANGLVRRLGEVSRLVADLAAAAEE